MKRRLVTMSLCVAIAYVGWYLAAKPAPSPLMQEPSLETFPHFERLPAPVRLYLPAEAAALDTRRPPIPMTVFPYGNVRVAVLLFPPGSESCAAWDSLPERLLAGGKEVTASVTYVMSTRSDAPLLFTLQTGKNGPRSGCRQEGPFAGPETLRSLTCTLPVALVSSKAWDTLHLCRVPLPSTETLAAPVQIPGIQVSVSP
jgi:hypothetical protein